ncbi:Uncharacterised protein [Serratia plymuthica]|nr:Uncharacterised protein [Serratia plymuthica]
MAGTFTKHYSDVQRIPFITVKGKSEVFSPADKTVYFYLLSLQENAGQVFPSISTLSRELGIPERTVQRSIKWLREALLVDVQRRYDSSNLYSITPPHEVMRIASGVDKPANRLNVVTGKFSATTEAVLDILRKMGVIHEDATSVIKTPPDPLETVKKEKTGVSTNYKLEPTVKYQEEYEVCIWTGELIPNTKQKEQAAEDCPW